uniref:Poly [ADP-ribose] polymerase n=1 Tax=Romanomermis culicivorax TaxID=13658 RepID=A0A915KN97_ROMCU
MINMQIRDNGCVVPLGRLKNAVNASPEPKNYSLLYNEYIVYDVNQIKMKYLVKIEFNYKR